MPLYEYQCLKCGHRFERLQKFSDRSVTKCPKCKGKVERLISSSAIQFKGSGWYVTDYAGRSGSKDSAEPGGKSSESSAKPAKEAPKEASKESSKESAKESAKDSSKTKPKSGKQ